MKNKLDLKDILVIAGSLLVGYGIWRIFPPAAYITIGLEMCFLGYFRS